MSNENNFESIYAYQVDVKDSPMILAWHARVNAAVAAMAEVEVQFATNLQERSEGTEVYHDHDKQKIAAFLAPVLSSIDGGEFFDEDALPYFRVRFTDGAELLADDSELFSLDPSLGELLAAVSGAYAIARDMGFVGPWSLAANGTDEQKAEFMEAFGNFKLTPPLPGWLANHNVPAEFRNAALMQLKS